MPAATSPHLSPRNEQIEALASEALTIPEVCKILRISQPTLHRRIADGTVESVKIGQARKFRRADIEALLAGER